jgi:DNA-binding protein HU-beta
MAQKKPVTAAKPAPAKAAAPAGAKAGAVTTTTLKQLAAGIAESHDMPKRQAETLLNSLVEAVSDRLKAGEKVRLTGLGILQVRQRAARTGRNPATGEEMQIKASKKIAFTAAKELKEAI